jgi:hypothetical protein
MNIAVHACNPRIWEEQQDHEFEISLDYIAKPSLKKPRFAGPWWLTPIILGTQEAEIKRLWFKASPGK